MAPPPFPGVGLEEEEGERGPASGEKSLEPGWSSVSNIYLCFPFLPFPMDDMDDGGDDGVYRGPTLAAVDEEEEQLLRNFGENKLMGRVQEALRVQLEDQLARLNEDLRETEQAREASRIHREDVGVQLYGVQQQLASLQVSLDRKTERVNALAEGRARDEAAAARVAEAFALRNAALRTAEAQLEAFRGELDGILDTTRQVEKYNEEMAGEVAENKRATLKAAEATREKEKEKLAQDAYIDRMTQAVRRAGDELATFQSSIDAQRAEGAAAQAPFVGCGSLQAICTWSAAINCTR